MLSIIDCQGLDRQKYPSDLSRYHGETGMCSLVLLEGMEFLLSFVIYKKSIVGIAWDPKQYGRKDTVTLLVNNTCCRGLG